MRILIVDDEPGFRLVFAEILLAEGHEVRDVCDAASAREALATFDAEVLVVDWILRDGSQGPQLAAELQAAQPGLGVVLMTGFHAADLAKAAEPLDARVLQKPFSVADLLAAVSAVAAVSR